jgi:hypothetical protein
MSMTLRQKHIVAILAIADILVTVALVVLVTRPFDTTTSPHPRPQTLSVPQQTCQWRATQLLARAGLGGTVALTPDGSLRLRIMYPLAPGQTVDEAAQSVWTAFDVALALQEQAAECAIFTTVEITILARNGQPDTQIDASVSVEDLVAFNAGELSEDAFIERVTYTTSVPRNE